MRLDPVALALIGLLAATPCQAALTQKQIDTVRAAPTARAAVPLDLPLEDLSGRPLRLGEAMAGRPTLLMLADYRCTQLCGSMLGIAGQALHASGLAPNRDFSFVIVGFNPDAQTADAARLFDDALASFPNVKGQARVLTGDPSSIDKLESVLGFTAVRDVGSARFAHPADLYVLTADGRVSRLINGLAIDPDELRLALVEAGEGKIGSLVDRLHVLCYGLDPLRGASTGLAQTMLRIGASLTLLGGFGALALRRLKPGGARHDLPHSGLR